MAKRKSVNKSSLSYNRVLKLSDFDKLDMYIRNRKSWEIAMALKTLRELGATSPDAIILGVGAAKERTIFELANENDCRFVIPSDLYFNMGVWKDWAGPDFVQFPGAHVPEDIDADPWRILPRNADMTMLPIPDNNVDGIFSSGSIEHVGQKDIFDGEAIAKAASEIGRVLRPGGIASLSTEWKISGNGWGFGHVRLFDEDTIQKYIIEPSGLELVDKPDWSMEETEPISLMEIVKGKSDVGFGYISHTSPVDGVEYIFTSVHLALRKPTGDEPKEKVVITEGESDD